MHFNLPKFVKADQPESSPSPSPTPPATPAQLAATRSNDPPPYDESMSPTISNSGLRTVTSGSGRTSAAPPITRSSSSSLLRAKPTEKKKLNVPYTPSQEQQKHINLLNSSGGGIPTLSAVSSGAQTDYFDVLPSFQMFQSILKRDDSQFSENLLVQPPVYGEESSSTSTPPNEPSGSSVETVAERLAEYELNEQHSDEDYLFGDEEVQSQADEAHEAHQAHEGNHITPNDTYGHTVLDNIDRLPKLNTSPIDIQIFVTKKVPQPNQSNELETRLKEYTSGDFVNGYIVITNKTDAPVDFGLFIVTLEGTIKATERDLSMNELNIHRFKKVLMKKFLKMYDLNASYGYAHVPSSAGIEYEAFRNDTFDGCTIGLPTERILEPHVKYKKFFTFKFPDKLLDNNCIDNLLPHNLPPPSYGLDRTSFYNRGDTIQLNKALGYGFLGLRGTPLLTRDYAFDDISVSYTIEAKFIDKLDADDQRHPLSHNEINDPNSEANYVISKSNQYFLRFIPDLKEQLEYYKQGIDISTSTFGSLGIDGKLFQNYLQLNTWKAINELNYQIEKEIDMRLTRDELTEDELKDKNLLVHTKSVTASTFDQLESKERIARQVYYDGGDSYEHNESFYYQDKQMIGTPVSTTVFGKKKKKILSSLVMIGDLRLFVKVPSKTLPYASPKLLMKYNNGGGALSEDVAGIGFHSVPSIGSPIGSPSLMPVTSNVDENMLRPISSASSASSSFNMLDIYNRDPTDILSNVEVELVFDPLSNSVTPPLISSIELNLVLWSFNTEYPLPVAMEYDFFYRDGRPDASAHSEVVDDVEITKLNLTFLKEQVGYYIQFLKSNKTFISKNSYLYLKAIKSLGVKKDTIKDFFKTLTHSSHDSLINSEGGWVIQQLPNQKFKWVKKLSLPLIPINKNSITLVPSFQSCLVGRIYCLQVVVKYKGSGGEQNEFADNVVKVDVPVLVG